MRLSFSPITLKADLLNMISREAENALAKAGELGWTVVSMKDDWATIF